MWKKWYWCVWGIGVVVVAWSVTAEERVQKLEEVVVKGRRYSLESVTSTALKMKALVRDVPQSVQLIPREEIDEWGARNVREVLELNVPGLGLDTANNTKDRFIIRGFRAEAFRDGLREVSPPRLNVSDVERVEILKGPASVLYGRSEPGAMVNLISKRAVWEPIYTFSLTGTMYAKSRNEGYADLGGLFDDTVAVLDMGGPVLGKRFAYRLIGYFDTADGWRDYVHEKMRDVAACFEGKIGAKGGFSLRVAYYDRDQVTDRGLIGRDGEYPAPLTTFYGTQGQLSATNELIVEPRIKYEVGNGMLLRNTFRYTLHDKEEVSLRARRVEDNFIGAFGGTEGQDGVYESVEREQRQIDEDYYWFTEQLELVGSGVLGGKQHDYLVGLEITRIDGTRQDFRLRNSDAVDDPLFHTSWLDPDNTVGIIEATIDHPLASGKRDVDFTSTYYGLYLQDRVVLTPQWKVVGGVRFDRYEDELENPYKTVNPQQEVTDNVFSWRLGGVYEPVKSVSVYGVVSRGFKPTGGVYSSNIERDDGMDFEPEEHLLYEVGTKSALLDGRLAVLLSIYQVSRKNFPTTDPDTGETEQIGEQRSRGVELLVESSPMESLLLQGSYAYTDAEYVEYYKRGNDYSGNVPAFVPENTVSLAAVYDLERRIRKPLKVGGALRWVGERWQEDANENKFDAYTVVDVFGEYAFSDSVLVRMNIKNLFNEEYFRSGTGYGDYAKPGDPFTLEVSLDMKF